MRNIETFPSKQMYPYLSLDKRKVAEFYHNKIERWLVWLKWLIFINFSGQLMVSMPKIEKRFKFGVCFSTLEESPRSEKVTNIFHWMLLLSMKCKIWRLEWSGLVVWLQTAFGDNPSEICARKTRGISVSHICAKIQPLLSSAWEECDQWTFFIPTNGLITQRNLFLSYFSRFDFLPIRFFIYGIY